jgi:hypothetical protein
MDDKCKHVDGQDLCRHPVGIRYERVVDGVRVAYNDLCNLHLALHAIGKAMGELKVVRGKGPRGWRA